MVRESRVGVRITAVAAIVSLATAAAVHGQTTVFYVDDDAAAGGDGASWQTAFHDLQDALATAKVAGASHAATRAEIRVAEGVYRPAPVGQRGVSFRIDNGGVLSAIVLLGGFAGPAHAASGSPDRRDVAAFASVLSGDLARNDDASSDATFTDNSWRVVDIGDTGHDWRDNDDGYIDGFTISGGNADGLGGAGTDVGGGAWVSQYSWDESGIRNCRFIGNRALRGGGAALVQSGEFDRCDFIGNRAMQGDGGAVLVDANGAAGLGRCTFRGNRAHRGGAAASLAPNEENSGISLYECVIEGNRANVEGGGVASHSRHFSARRCVFRSNAVDIRGGAIVADGRVYMENVLLCGNVAGADCATLVVGAGGSLIQNCTFVDNASLFAPSIHMENQWPRTDVINCVFRSRPPDPPWSAGPEVVVADPWGYVLMVACNAPGPESINGGAGLARQFMRYGDPIFADQDGPDGDPLTVADNDYRPIPGSPLVDAGLEDQWAGLYTIDLDGRPRYVNALIVMNRGIGARPFVDIGAYEFQGGCAADFNQSGAVDTQDVFDYLMAFQYVVDGSENTLVDFNRSGAVTVQDIYEFLTAWAPGCGPGW